MQSMWTPSRDRYELRHNGDRRLCDKASSVKNTSGTDHWSLKDVKDVTSLLTNSWARPRRHRPPSGMAHQTVPGCRFLPAGTKAFSRSRLCGGWRPPLAPPPGPPDLARHCSDQHVADLIVDALSVHRLLAWQTGSTATVKGCARTATAAGTTCSSASSGPGRAPPRPGRYDRQDRVAIESVDQTGHRRIG
jgi:hypothetical protein